MVSAFLPFPRIIQVVFKYCLSSCSSVLFPLNFVVRKTAVQSFGRITGFPVLEDGSLGTNSLLHLPNGGNLMNAQEVAAPEEAPAEIPQYQNKVIRVPWKIGPDEFTKLVNPVLIWQTLETVKNNHIEVTLVTEDGRKIATTNLMTFDSNRLLFELPVGFDLSSFNKIKVFLKDSEEVWNYFEVKKSIDCSFVLCTTYPEAFYCLQRRLHPRLNLPAGTRASFWVGAGMVDAIAIDISQAGMLISVAPETSALDKNDLLSGIEICHSSEIVAREIAEESASCPVIQQGWLVRSFRDRYTHRTCHGIAFDGDAITQEALTDIINFVRLEENSIAV